LTQCIGKSTASLKQPH